MHETTRRTTCRAGFVLGCVAPTLGMLGWIVYLATPSHRASERAEWQRRLSEAVGVQVTVASVQHPESSLVRLTQVSVVDPETGAVLADAPVIDLARRADGWVAHVPSARTPRDQLRRLTALFQSAQWRKSAHDLVDCQLLAGEVQITDAEAPATLLDVHLRTGGVPEVRHELEFRIPGLDLAQPIRLIVTRHRDSSSPYTEWQFSTGPQAIPSSTLALGCPELAELGPDSQLTGTIRLHERDGRWTGEAEGRMTQVELDRLVTGRFPHKLTGMAEVVISRMAWQEGRLADLAGTVTSSRGIVSRSLLEASASDEGLRLNLAPRVQESDDTLWRFHELAFGFELTSEGLQVAGQCEGDRAGVLVVDAQGPLLTESTQPLVPAVALIRVLAPQNEIQVPASRQTDALLRWFPLPSITPVDPSVARPAYVPLRLR